VKQESAKPLIDGLNVLTTGTGISASAWGMLEAWQFINTNAAGVGVLLTFLFGTIAILFNIYNSFKLSKSDKNEANIKRQEESIVMLNHEINRLKKSSGDKK